MSTRLMRLRVIVGVFATGYVAIRAPVFFGLADRDPATFEPVGVLWWLDEPLPDALITAAVIAVLVAGAAFTMGTFFRISGPVFALLLLSITTYRSSMGQLLWFENLMVLHVLVIGFSRAADSRSDDLWPVRLCAIVTVLTYVLAGIAKLRTGGFAWMDGDTLRNHVAYSATRLDVLGGTPSPFARPFVANSWLSSPLAVATIAVELGAPVALLGGRWRTAWVAAAWALHAGIALVMFVVFPYPLLLVAFAPLFPLERIGSARWGTRSCTSSTVTSPPSPTTDPTR